MGFWFGRKSAPEARPFVPVWLQGEAESGGFVRGIEGMTVLDRASGHMIVRRGGAWESGIARLAEVRVNGDRVLHQRQAAVPNPSGGSTIDAECRAAVIGILERMRAHGLIG